MSALSCQLDHSLLAAVVSRVFRRGGRDPGRPLVRGEFNAWGACSNGAIKKSGDFCEEIAAFVLEVLRAT
jgi:hypothetical protein